MLRALKAAAMSTGAITLAEKTALASLAFSLKPGSVILEVGTFQGGTSRMLCEAAPQARVYSLDPYDRLAPDFVAPDNLTLFRGTSAEFAERHPDLRADLLFIDANHSLACVLHDIAHCRPLLEENAVVAFHDYTMSCLGVVAACNALMEAGCVRDCCLTDSLFTARTRGPLAADTGLAVLGAALVADSTWLTTPGCRAPVRRDEAHESRMERIYRTRGDADGPVFVGRGTRGRIVARMAGIDQARMIDSADVADNGRDCVLCSAMVDEIAGFLEREKGISPDRCVDGQDFFDYCCLEDLLRNRGRRLESLMAAETGREVVRHLASNPPELLRSLYRYHGFAQLFGLNFVMIFADASYPAPFFPRKSVRPA